MNSQLVPVFDGTISDESALLCNARDLHRFLGVGKMFAHWIKERIAEYEFVENQDYILLANIGKQTSGRGGHNRKDYHLTLDTAKELAMVERNDKGRQVRRYFIDCEKRLRNNVVVTQQSNALNFHNCRVLHTYNDLGVIVSSQVARDDEMFTSPKGFIELMMRRQGI